MAKKKSKSKHTVHSAFPSQGSPMDPSNMPVANLPSPQGGAFGGAAMQNPGAPMLPGEPL